MSTLKRFSTSAALLLMSAVPLHAQGLVGGIAVDSAIVKFEPAVITYLQDVRLEPARRDGRPSCALVMNQPFNFSLKP